MAQPSWFDYVLGDLRWLAHPGSTPSVIPGEAAARAKPLTDLVSGIGRGIGGIISDMADMHDWRFGDPLPDLSKSRQAISTVLRYTVPDPVHDPWGAGMMMAMGSGPHPEWPPKLAGPKLSLRDMTGGQTPYMEPEPGSFMGDVQNAVEYMAPHGLLWEGRAPGTSGGPAGPVNNPFYPFTYPRPQVPYSRQLADRELQGINTDVLNPHPSTAPVPGSGADYRYTPDPIVERIIRRTEVQGSLDRAIEAAKNKFQYPPTQVDPDIGKLWTEADLQNAVGSRGTVDNMPYNQWTTTTTDALAQQFGVRPEWLHKQWDRRLTPDVHADYMDMLDAAGIDKSRFRVPHDVLSLGPVENGGRTNFWEYLGNDRWRRILGRDPDGTAIPYTQKHAGPQLDSGVMSKFLDDVWGKDPAGWQPTRLSSDQMAEFLMDNKDNASVHGNLADIASGRFGKLDMTGQWRGFRDQDGFHSWERVPEWEDQINQSIMPLGAYGDAAMPKVALEREIIAPGHEHEYQIGSSVLVYGNKWTKGANGRWFRMTGPGIDQ